MRDIRAVVFDMDGVIFDSERCVCACWETVAAEQGLEDIRPVLIECLGTNDALTRQIFARHYPGADYSAFAAEASRLFHARHDGGRLPVKPGAGELLAALAARGVPVALASSTRRESVTRELGEAGLLPFFRTLVCGDMVRRSKPEPDIYLTACGALGVDPASAAAVEDSFNGIRSARAAGMVPLMVPDMVQPTEEIRALAAAVLPDLFAVRAWLEVASAEQG